MYRYSIFSCYDLSLHSRFLALNYLFETVDYNEKWHAGILIFPEIFSSQMFLFEIVGYKEKRHFAILNFPDIIF